ncbi:MULTISPECIES: LysR family transcriptional regulator [Microbacterium]|uniref:LysR family transcriptional regulator n=1 Tax=Microbacterium TaxID=33882 RepID=UPI00300FABD2
MTPTGEGARDIELRTIRILSAIEEEGSITAAAQRLGYSQPAVSQHLQRAESRIGMPLITRLGRRIKLTEAGAAIAAIAPQVIGAVDDVLTQLDGLTQLRSGNVRLRGFPSASSTLVPTLLNDVRTARPGIAISYTESEPHDSLEALASGECDVALVCGYDAAEMDAAFESFGIESNALFVDPLYAVLPRDHPLADETTVDLVDLEDDDWISGWHTEEVCRNLGFTPKVSMTTDNFIAVLGLVARGFGVSLLPRLPLTTAAIPRGCVIKPTNPQEYRTIHVATMPERSSIPAVKLTTGVIAGLDGTPWRLNRPGSVVV